MTFDVVRERARNCLEITKNTERYPDVFSKFVRCPLTKDEEKELYLIFKQTISVEEAHLFTLFRRVQDYNSNDQKKLKQIQSILYRIKKRKSEDDKFWTDLTNKLSLYPYCDLFVQECAHILEKRGLEILNDTLKVLNGEKNNNKRTLFNLPQHDKIWNWKFPKETESPLWNDVLSKLEMFFIRNPYDRKVFNALYRLEKEGTLTPFSVQRVLLCAIFTGFDLQNKVDHTIQLLARFLKISSDINGEELYKELLLKSPLFSILQMKNIIKVFGGSQPKNPFYFFIWTQHAKGEIEKDVFKKWTFKFKKIQWNGEKFDDSLKQLTFWKNEIEKVEKESPVGKLLELMNQFNFSLKDASLMTKEELAAYNQVQQKFHIIWLKQLREIIGTDQFQRDFSLFLKAPHAASEETLLIKKLCDFYFTGENGLPFFLNYMRKMITLGLKNLVQNQSEIADEEAFESLNNTKALLLPFKTHQRIIEAIPARLKDPFSYWLGIKEVEEDLLLQGNAPFTFLTLDYLNIQGNKGHLKWISTAVSNLLNLDFMMFSAPDENKVTKPSLFISLQAVEDSRLLMLNQSPAVFVFSFPVLKWKGANSITDNIEWFRNLKFHNHIEKCIDEIKMIFFPGIENLNEVEVRLFQKLFYIRQTLFLITYTKAETFAFIGDSFAAAYTGYMIKILTILIEGNDTFKEIGNAFLAIASFDKAFNVQEIQEFLEFLDDPEVQRRLKENKELFHMQKMNIPKLVEEV